MFLPVLNTNGAAGITALVLAAFALYKAPKYRIPGLATASIGGLYLIGGLWFSLAMQSAYKSQVLAPASEQAAVLQDGIRVACQPFLMAGVFTLLLVLLHGLAAKRATKAGHPKVSASSIFRTLLGAAPAIAGVISHLWWIGLLSNPSRAAQGLYSSTTIHLLMIPLSALLALVFIPVAMAGAWKKEALTD